jgi:hypothetical protein
VPTPVEPSGIAIVHRWLLVAAALIFFVILTGVGFSIWKIGQEHANTPTTPAIVAANAGKKAPLAHLPVLPKTEVKPEEEKVPEEMVGLLPVDGAGDQLPPPTKVQLLTSTNNLKEIALAFLICSDTNHKYMPTDITSKDGKALLSWRVAILPYIENVKLYKQFKMDEPWDSENNKKLIEKMPSIYAPVRVMAKKGETFYQVFTGKNTLFVDPKNPPRYPASITDGTSNTALVFEAGTPVIWSKPADLAYDEKKPLPKLGGLFDGEFHVALCDGSVMRLKKEPDEEQLRNFITPSGAEIVDFKKLEAK